MVLRDLFFAIKLSSNFFFVCTLLVSTCWDIGLIFIKCCLFCLMVLAMWYWLPWSFQARASYLLAYLLWYWLLFLVYGFCSFSAETLPVFRLHEISHCFLMSPKGEKFWTCDCVNPMCLWMYEWTCEYMNLICKLVFSLQKGINGLRGRYSCPHQKGGDCWTMGLFSFDEDNKIDNLGNYMKFIMKWSRICYYK